MRAERRPSEAHLEGSTECSQSDIESEANMFGLKRRRDGKSNETGRTKTRNCNVVDLSQAPYISFGVGIVKGNPKRCLHCGKPIRKGEPWRKATSAADPEYGRYSVIVHSGCDGATAVR